MPGLGHPCQQVASPILPLPLANPERLACLYALFALGLLEMPSSVTLSMLWQETKKPLSWLTVQCKTNLSIFHALSLAFCRLQRLGEK